MAHIIGDVLLKQVALGADDLLAAVTDRGRNKYSNYVNLVPGDYQYQNAHMALRFYAPYGKGQPSVSDLALNIDLQDVTENIIGTVSAGWTLFNFAKKFNIPPTVTVFQRDGTVLASGQTRNVTKTSFEAALVASSGFIAGNISALAYGY